MKLVSESGLPKLGWKPSEQKDVVLKPFPEYSDITFWTLLGSVRHNMSRLRCSLVLSKHSTSASMF